MTYSMLVRDSTLSVIWGQHVAALMRPLFNIVTALRLLLVLLTVQYAVMLSCCHLSNAVGCCEAAGQRATPSLVQKNPH
jgi:hypothetical protein